MLLLSDAAVNFDEPIGHLVQHLSRAFKDCALDTGNIDGYDIRPPDIYKHRVESDDGNELVFDGPSRQRQSSVRSLSRWAAVVNRRKCSVNHFAISDLIKLEVAVCGSSPSDTRFDCPDESIWRYHSCQQHWEKALIRTYVDYPCAGNEAMLRREVEVRQFLKVPIKGKSALGIDNGHGEVIGPVMMSYEPWLVGCVREFRPHVPGK